ncbi:MAG: type II secretion system protein [Firmicutes bacterium]|nr:type II secretion system protein [Bacillota bacterium]
MTGFIRFNSTLKLSEGTPLYRREAGFSLIEVLAAVALVGILIIPLLSMFTGSIRAVLLAGQETKAVSLAQEKMEVLKGKGYAQLKKELQEQKNSPRREAVGDYWWETELKCLPLSHLFPGLEEGAEIIFLRVSVFWGEEGKQRSVSLVSYLGEDPVRLPGGP